jgi:hypothetical protein
MMPYMSLSRAEKLILGIPKWHGTKCTQLYMYYFSVLICVPNSKCMYVEIV